MLNQNLYESPKKLLDLCYKLLIPQCSPFLRVIELLFLGVFFEN